MIQEDVLQIYLNNEVVIMHGSPEDAVGSVVSGTVVFTPTKSVKIRSICLTLEGTLSLENLQELNGVHKVLTKNILLLLGSGIGYHSFEGGQQYRYDFELLLRGDAPETVEVPGGRIYYQVSVMVSRPFPYSNIKRHKSFRVERIHLLTEILEITNYSSGIWGKYITYHISIPKKRFTAGETIPISAKYKFKASSPHIDKISCRLVEVIVSRNPTTLVETLETTQLVRRSKYFEDSIEYEQPYISERINIKVPTASRCQCSTKFITITHKLLIKTSFVNSKNKGWSATVELPVLLLSSRQSELSNGPPGYSAIDTQQLPLISPPAYAFPEEQHFD